MRRLKDRPRYALAARVTAVCCLIGGCAPEAESELLEVHHVAPDRVEPGHILEVRGEGFPPGRSARVRLEGRMLRPGEAPRRVRVELTGRAVSNEAVETRFTAGALSALGGRGTLHGNVTVSFETMGHGWVVGRSGPVQLDVTPPSTEQLAGALARARRATLLAAELGLTLGEEAPDQPGLPVEAVDEGSSAERAGIASADRLIAIDGVRVHAISDLLPPPAARRTTLELARVGEASTFQVRVPLASPREGLSSRELRAAQVALAWTLLIALLLAPSAAIIGWMARPPAPRGGAPTRHGPAALRVVIGTAFLTCIVALDHAGLLRVPLELLIATLFAARTSAAYLDSDAGWPRARGVSAALGAAVLATIALGMLAAQAGTSDLATLHALGGAAPWNWPALRAPAGPLLVALLVIAGSWRARSRAAAAIEESSALALAGTTAAALLGGWSAPLEGPAGQLLGALTYVVCALSCWAAMRTLGRARPRRLVVSASILAALAIAAGAAWMLGEPPPLERGLSEALTAVLAITCVVLLYRRIAESAPADPAPALPFL